MAETPVVARFLAFSMLSLPGKRLYSREPVSAHGVAEFGPFWEHTTTVTQKSAGGTRRNCLAVPLRGLRYVVTGRPLPSLTEPTENVVP